MKWTKEILFELAAQYESKSDMRQKNPAAMAAAYRLGVASELYPNIYNTWTLENLLAEAARYSSRSEFREKNHYAYVVFLSRYPDEMAKVLDDKRIKWDEDTISKVAAGCVSKWDFQRRFSGAYQAATIYYPGLIDKLFINQYNSWDYETICAAASECSSKVDFQRKYPGAYNATNAYYPGLIDKLFDNQLKSWNYENICQEAKNYSSRKGFHRGCQSASNAARRLGIMDDLFDILNTPGDYDAFYILKAIGLKEDGVQVYKFGATSVRCNDDRLKHLRSKNQIPYEQLFYAPVNCDARDLENLVRHIGLDPGYTGETDGATEHRCYTDDELDDVLYILLDYVDESRE